MSEIANIAEIRTGPMRPLVPQVAETPKTTMDLIYQATMSGNLELVEKLMELQERHERMQARRAFDAAIADAKAKGLVVRKNRHVGFKSKDASKPGTDYDHEDFAEIARTVDPILGPLGLSYRFRVKQADKITVTCILAHRDGHFEENELAAPADTTGNKNPIQAIGSTVTYLQRYTLKSALGLAAAKDDDGLTASEDRQEDAAISEVQTQELIALMDDLGVNKRDFCVHHKIDGVAEIRLSQFENAKKSVLSAADNRRRREEEKRRKEAANA